MVAGVVVYGLVKYAVCKRNVQVAVSVPKVTVENMYLDHILTMAFLLWYCFLFVEAVLEAFHLLEMMMKGAASRLAQYFIIILKLLLHGPQNVLTSIEQGRQSAFIEGPNQNWLARTKPVSTS